MRAYISLGSNLGNRIFYINKAVEMLGRNIKKVSPIIETEPVDMDTDNGKFLNAVAEIETKLSPVELLDFLEDIERQLGRTDKGNHRSRTIDLDILSYGGLEIDTPRLKIPHPRLKERDFLCKLLKKLERKRD